MQYRDLYMTPDGVYIRIAGSTKPPHWLPHLVPDSLLLQEISYQTFVNGVPASLHRNNKGLWPQFPLITQVCKIENFKQTIEHVSVLSSYKFREVSFKRHDPQGKLKEHLQEVGFLWSYSHEYLLPRELSQQQVLVSLKYQLQTKCLKWIKKQRQRKPLRKRTKLQASRRISSE